MVDPMGKLITEIRADSAVTAITTRIRGGEAAPGDSARPYQPFVVLVRLGLEREPRVPIQRLRIGFRCYGATFQQAAQLYGAVSDAIHNVGPRIGATGVVIYRSFDDTGGAASKDPDTGQPYEDGVISLIAATQVAA